MPENQSDILLIDKPKGITSFGVIYRLRKKLGIRKIGHAGTLDPLATGLLIVGVGEGTKKLTSLIKLDKEYIAEILIGEKRSTGDMEGKVTEEKIVTDDVPGLEQKITAALDSLIGEIELPVSAYSAIKIDGVPMYKRARKAEKTGEIVTEVPHRVMRVDEAELIGVVQEADRALASVRFTVGSGTYIRSLAEELGTRIGYPATIYNLRRTRVGEYVVTDAEII